MDTKKHEELTLMALWINHIIDYSLPVDSEAYSLFKEIVLQTLNKKDLRGMRAVAKDINEWTKDLPEAQRKILNDQLVSRFGEGLKTISQSKVKKVLLKGEIKNEREYRLLLDYVEENYADESKKEEIEAINKLLAKFHQ